MSPTSALPLAALKGPILVLGASGFVGAALFRALREARTDVFGVASHLPAWRLEGLPAPSLLSCDLLSETQVKALIEHVQPETVFDCAAYGAYSFQTDTHRIYQTNFQRLPFLCQLLQKRQATYLSFGSSSEYGVNSQGPLETQGLTPNSHYAVSKAAASQLLFYLGTQEAFRCAHLRLYSIYGPGEDASRLIPQLLKKALEKKYPPLADPEISRDFIFIEDVLSAAVTVALNLQKKHFGKAYNIGTERETKLKDLGTLVQKLFQIPEPPTFSNFENRRWDVPHWVSCSNRIQEELGWKAQTSLEQGLKQTATWVQCVPQWDLYEKRSKKFSSFEERSLSIIIACYRDGQAIPVMHQRLTQVLQALGIDYEIIFVNDGSPDDSSEVIHALSSQDSHVVGITHSRNFGSQAAFRSGMELASKRACILMDGDLQDPPELIPQFYEAWKKGYDVVYGRRVKREASLPMQLAYKVFYYFFQKLSYIAIPRDAGDFSLIDRKVVQVLLRFPERDLFLRGLRAFVGFQQTGVDYVRPERLFGKSTNHFFKNIGWAKKGILSFSHLPLNGLSFIGVIFFLCSLGLAFLQALSKILWPQSAPAGITTVLVILIFFGSLNLLGISLLGEYLAKVFEEVKQRPHFIRKTLIRHGKSQDLVS